MLSVAQVADEAPPPLPIAAAHHPAHLHALRATLFPAKSKASHHAGSDQTDGPASIPVSHAVTERLAAIDKLNISLQTALADAQSMHAQLQHRLGKARAKAASAQPVKKAKGASGQLQLDTSLWSPRTGKGVDFKVGQSSYRRSHLLLMCLCTYYYYDNVLIICRSLRTTLR